jgi:hypothetical protein
MVSLAKLIRIMQGIGKKYKKIGLKKIWSLIECKNRRKWSSNNKNYIGNSPTFHQRIFHTKIPRNHAFQTSHYKSIQ